MRADALDVGDEVLGGVGAGREIGVAATCAALIEEDGAEAVGVEESAVTVLGTRAWPAMEEEGRDAIAAAELLHNRSSAHRLLRA